MKKYRDGTGNICYSSKKYHFTITKNQDNKPILLESVLGVGWITRKHAAELLRRGG